MSRSLIANNIRALRVAAGLSQAELGELLGVLQGRISKMENGTEIPGDALMIRLCLALRKQPSEIYTFNTVDLTAHG